MIPVDLLADIALTRINNPTAKVVLLAIARYANSKGECFPSRETIANDACLSVRSVVSAIQWLKSESFLRIEPRSGISNVYVITSMEEDMTDDTRAKSAHEGDSNITKLDFSKRREANYTTPSCAKSAHPLDTPFFLAFWQAYPRRIGKGAARTAFLKAERIADPSFIVQAAVTYARYVEEQSIDQQYIPHAATWLNAERWEDDLEGEAQSRKNKSGWGDALDGL